MGGGGVVCKMVLVYVGVGIGLELGLQDGVGVCWGGDGVRVGSARDRSLAPLCVLGWEWG